MKDTLAHLYYDGKIIDAQLNDAVTKGWITQQDADDIKNGWTGDIILASDGTTTT